MNTTSKLLTVAACCAILACTKKEKKTTEEASAVPESTVDYQAVSASQITIDGLGDEQAWAEAKWHNIDQRWLGEEYSAEDFSGRFKLAWDSNYLYVLAEIVDDTLIDIHQNPLDLYWDDDCLEIFIDEDASGGNHQYNHNAFAYHIALDYAVADVDSDSSFILLNDHVETKRSVNGNTYTWEVAMKVFDDSFRYQGVNTPVTLSSNKTMGFAIAYCDNDRSAERENFIGSEVVEGEDKNIGWIDAGIFGRVILD